MFQLPVILSIGADINSVNLDTIITWNETKGVSKELVLIFIRFIYFNKKLKIQMLN